jgi:prepilin-type N-terminal cleavage/methylation domain-containing protein
MKNKGFTLLEIVISMLILSLVVAGAYGLFVSNYRLLVDAKHRLQAVNQAAAVMEKLKSYVSADPNLPINAGNALKTGDLNDDGVVDATDVHLPQSEIGLLASPFMTEVANQKWNYKVEDVSGADIKKVTVTVNWDNL